MTATVARNTRAALFTDTNFRWLLGGGVISMLGDQFTLIALPWLVLRLTGDPLALGLVLATMSLPRAAFILVGGALVDRHSPKAVLLLTKYVNAGLLALLAALVWSGGLQLWMVHGLALGIGLATAFSYPAGSSILPQALPSEALQPANGVLMSLRQLTVLIGPVMAGGMIALLGSHSEASSLVDGRGLGLAFALDALSFAVSAWTLARVKTRPPAAAAQARPMLNAIGEALRAFWADTALRTLCLYFAAVGFFVGGPIQVALPVLASQQLGGQASALGLLLAGHGAGVLAGMALSGLRPGWRIRTLGTTMLVIDTAAGLLFVGLGHVGTVWEGMAVLVLLGALGGFVQVAVFSWMQKRVAPAMLGRTMSLFMFIFMGLAPLSAAAAGAAMRWLPLQALFTLSGATLAGLALLGLLFTPIRRIEDQQAPSAPALQS